VAFWRARARWLEAENGELRAERKRLRAEKKALGGRVSELEGQVAALTQKLATLTRRVFGRSSEKAAAAVGEGGPGWGGASGGRSGGGGGRRGQRPGSAGHGRRDYSHLDTREVVHDLPEAQRVCPRCGAGYVPFAEQRCEQVDWQVRLVRVVHRRPSYRRGCRCAVAGVVAAPPPPKAVGKGRFTTGFMARLLVEKFVLGRPVHRIAAGLACEGLDLAAGTVAGVLAAVSGLLAPLAAAISARNAASGHLHADETSWRVFAEVEGKDSYRWWCWVFVGPDTTVFQIAKSRSLAVLGEHLGLDTSTGELPEGRGLLLSSDFYAVYQSLGTLEGVDSLWCWAHVRRYFVRAGDAHAQLRVWRDRWLELIGALYAAHTAMAAAEPGGDAYHAAAGQFSAALGVIDTERRVQAARPGLHPAARQVLETLDREWDGLARHDQYPHLPLDNNTAERALRGPVIGRKNFYGSGSVASAELASRVWTITATAERAGVNVLTYLHGYLDACAQAGGKPPEPDTLTRFLPWTADATDLAAWRRAPAALDPGPQAGPAP
jgi:transposase